MYSVNRSALVMHSADKMFYLINDVERYAEFLPWCGGSKVLSESENQTIASVTIAVKKVNKTFTTRNVHTGKSMTCLSLIEGPFSFLEGEWRFLSLQPNSCKISLQLKFDFSNKLVAAVVGPVFNAIADSMVDSFCKRADDLYGNQ